MEEREVQPINERVKAALQERDRTGRSPEFEALEKFFEEMKEGGLAKPPEYTLPLLDTVGKTFCRSSHSRSRRAMRS